MHLHSDQMRKKTQEKLDLKTNSVLSCLFFLSLFCSVWEGEAVHLRRRTLLLSICSPVHLWNAPLVPSSSWPQTSLTEERPDSITAGPIRRPHPYLIPQVGPSNRRTGWKLSWGAKPMREGSGVIQNFKRGQPVLLGSSSVRMAADLGLSSCDSKDNSFWLV